MKHGSIVEKRSPPYLYEMFNVFYFFTSPLNFGNNSLIRINNALIEAFNCREQLPAYILIILDRDFIDMINRFDFGIMAQLEHCVNWLATQVTHHLKARREQLWNVKPGAVAQENTKIVWVEMFDRPINNNGTSDPAIKIRNKFNRGLNEVAGRHKFHHVMVLESLKVTRHFEPNGKLNYWGRLQFWKELDYLFKQFDRRKISLKLRKYVANEHNKLSIVQQLSSYTCSLFNSSKLRFRITTVHIIYVNDSAYI